MIGLKYFSHYFYHNEFSSYFAYLIYFLPKTQTSKRSQGPKNI